MDNSKEMMIVAIDDGEGEEGAINAGKPIVMKLGNSKKRKQIEIEQSNDGFGGDVDESIPKVPLVIPLIKPINTVAVGVVAKSEKSLESSNNKPKTLEEQAAEELIRELTEKPKSSDSSELLVIRMPGEDVAVAIDTTSAKPKAMPLLQANLAPELAGITNDDERFKVDLSLRADDVNFKSDSYKAVPVEEFGAALLRGMGWTGPSEADSEYGKKLSEKNVARVYRLGLGALAKPPEQKGSRIDKDTKAAIDKEWAKKAAERIAKQVLADDDLVWLKDPNHAGCRGKVVAVRGVPGLDKIRVMLEGSGRLVEVKRTDAVLLSADELAATPMKLFPAQERDLTVSAPGASAKVSSGDNLVSKSSSRREAESSSSKSSSTKSDSIRDKDSSQRGAVSSSTKSPAAGGVRQWLTTGIRVRLISKKVGTSRSYLQKGWVLDVYGSNLASVKLDDGSVIDGVKESYLETVLPSTGAECMVLAGEYAGLTATVLEKKKDAEKAVVQLTEELNVIFEISMDSIAAFSHSGH